VSKARVQAEASLPAASGESRRNIERYAFRRALSAVREDEKGQTISERLLLARAKSEGTSQRRTMDPFVMPDSLAQ
jgi:hypothetical protein